jgi:tungstate transport system permease protein
MGVFIDAFIEAFKLIIAMNPEIIEVTFLSFKISLMAVFLGGLIAIPIAFFISENNFYAKKILISIIHTAMAMPPVVVGLFVYIVLSRKGPLGYLDMLYSPYAMIFAQLIMAVPIIIGISLSAFNAVKKTKKEMIVSLGATKWQYFLKVLKEAKFGIMTAFVTSFGAAISEVGAIMIVGGNIRFHTRALTTSIVLETQRGNFALALALGIILISTAFIVSFALTYIQQKNPGDAQ